MVARKKTKKQANLQQKAEKTRALHNLTKKADVYENLYSPETEECAWLDAVALQNMLSLAENFQSKVLARLDHKILAIS